MSRLLVITELFLPTKGGTAVWAAAVSSPYFFRMPMSLDDLLRRLLRIPAMLE
jgi:hypothetical protein